MMPVTSTSSGSSTYLWTPWTSDEAQFPTPMIATLIFPTDLAPFSLNEHWFFWWSDGLSTAVNQAAAF
jgi:hypothetical protein